MNIQPISLMSCRKPHFTKNNERRTNTDRTPTVQDLYEMENRINERLDRQDKAMAEALWYLVDSATYDYSNLKGRDALKRQQIEAHICNTLGKLNSMDELDKVRLSTQE